MLDVGNVILTKDELRELTGRRRVALQARELDHLQIPYKRRSDGSIVVLRADLGRPQQGLSDARQVPRLRLVPA
jgi:hypothetical protein